MLRGQGEHVLHEGREGKAGKPIEGEVESSALSAERHSSRRRSELDLGLTHIAPVQMPGSFAHFLLPLHWKLE